MSLVLDLGRRVAGLMARRRYLPDLVAEPHVICSGESVAAALHRITTHQFTIAINTLADPHAEIGEAATSASAALGRIEALLRLVRPSIGHDTCDAELEVLADTRTFLAGLTDGAAEIHALDELRARYDRALRPEALSELRDQLLHRYQLRRIQQLAAVQPGGERDHWLQQLRRARARFAAWPIDASVQGKAPVSDAFDSFATGLERAYRKGAKQASADTPKIAKWRRRVADLSHQIELLSGAWPEVMAATVASATDLADVLAEYEQFAALRHAVASDVVVDEATTAVVDSLCVHECAELMSIATTLAGRLYAESSDAFTERVGSYWSTRPAGRAG
ncbi:MAG: CHAD domain-containing protein [Acidimicrobiales bacterium]